MNRSQSLVLMVTTLLFVVLLSGPAQAAGNVFSGHSGFQIDSFVPKIDAWINDSLKFMATFQVINIAGKIGQIAIGVFMVIALFNAWINRNLGIIAKQVIFSFAELAFIGAATTNNGVVGKLFTMPLTVWEKLYDASNAKVAPMIQDQVVLQTKQLAVSMHNFVLNASMGLSAMTSLSTQESAIFQNAGTEGSGGDANKAIGEQAIKDLKANAEKQTQAMNNASGIFTIGYVLLLTFFMAYAGIIYMSAMTIVLGMVLIPLGLAFWANGNSKVLQYIMLGALGSFITVVVAPPIMMVAARTALHQPTIYIKNQIDLQNSGARTIVRQYIARAEACASANENDWLLQSAATSICNVQSNGITTISEFARVTGQIIMGLGIMIMVMIVSLGVGAALIKQIPGLVSSMLGGGMGFNPTGVTTASQALSGVMRGVGMATGAAALGAGVVRGIANNTVGSAVRAPGAAKSLAGTASANAQIAATQLTTSAAAAGNTLAAGANKAAGLATNMG